ncbi:MAG: YbgC/FadM family acyl-CoA thioesterase [Sphingomonadales bacterium]
MTETDQLTPTSGFFKGNEHFLPIRVYYEDTDALAMVYHANFLKYMERGRTEFLRLLGIFNRELANRKDGMTWAVASSTIQYMASAWPDDAIVVISRVARLGAASVTIDQDIKRGDEFLTKGSIRVGCMNAEGRPRRMPNDLKEKFKTFNEQLK